MMGIVGQTRFGRAEIDDAARWLSGWSHPEDGFTSATGDESRFSIVIEHHDQAGRVMLELDLNPFVPPGSIGGQRSLSPPDHP